MIETENILIQALDQALETMAFLTILPEDEDMIVPQTTMLAEMSFSGPKEGTIQILTGPDFAEIIAENIGAMDEVNDDMRIDALKELANVTCGLLVPIIASAESDVFDLTVPAVKNGQDTPEWDQFTGQKDVTVSNIEGFAVATRLILNKQ